MNVAIKQAVRRHGLTGFRAWFIYCIGVAVMVPTLALIAMGWEMTLQTFMPASYWVEYRGVSPAKVVVSHDEPLIMRSYVRYHRRTDMCFSDVLYCDTGEGFTYIDDQTPELLSKEKSDHWQEGKAWQYNGMRPGKSAVCYMRSVAKICLPYTSDKAIVVQSDRFKLLGPSDTSGDGCL